MQEGAGRSGVLLWGVTVFVLQPPPPLLLHATCRAVNAPTPPPSQLRARPPYHPECRGDSHMLTWPHPVPAGTIFAYGQTGTWPWVPHLRSSHGHAHNRTNTHPVDDALAG